MFMLTVWTLTVLQMCTACSLPNICTDSSAVQEEIVNAHNAFRRAVKPTASNMLKMSWNQTVADSAQQWVDKCEMRHGPSSSRLIEGYELGENLFKTGGSNTWTEVVSAWHSEEENYQYPTGSHNGQPIGHYTQVVWYSSYQVGCGVAKCGSSYFYGCHYYRAGNFYTGGQGIPPYTEGEPCSACPDSCEDKLCTNPCPYINKFINCPALKLLAGCTNTYVRAFCSALCLCQTEIVPLAKK
ncbi:cysteine-rich venom protein latisemin [Alosa sapidissima]|uniref:cysteine-rich venom protein latisemin n=1 Tax=Alosa sapidissima TaxID=34773 RepID=UPI001C093867|nr:cysteine-rich venom protein latisemin [Alosa sapidissima]